MILDTKTKEDDDRRYHNCHPSAFHELLCNIENKDADTQDPADAMDNDLRFPIFMLFPSGYPKADHSCLTERERQEYIDRIHKNECGSISACIYHDGKSGKRHEHHTVLHRETVGERCKA